MKGTFDFSVLPEDSGGAFSDTKDCPAARAFRRQFPDVSFGGIGTLMINSAEGKYIARLEKGFNHSDYKDVAAGNEFHDKIYFYE